MGNKNTYPPPLSILPSSDRHTHTFILLHGRGSNANRFGYELLESTGISTRLPTVKFVFPTASKRRSTVPKETRINQWFDNYSLEDPGQRADLQIEGLCETSEFLRSLIGSEAKELGEGEQGLKKVILGGLSQGCAAGIFAFLGGGYGNRNGNGNDTSETLGGFIGMSAWLPLQNQLKDIVRSPPMSKDTTTTDDDDFNLFARSTDQQMVLMVI